MMQGASEQVWGCAALYKCSNFLRVMTPIRFVAASSSRIGPAGFSWQCKPVQPCKHPTGRHPCACRSRGVPKPWEQSQSLRSGKMEAVDQLEIVEMSDSLIRRSFPTKELELSHRPVAEQGCIRSTTTTVAETQDFYVGLCSVVW